MVLERFYKWIGVFGKKQSKKMPIRKVWDHMINLKEEFTSRKEKVHLLFREERKEVRELIEKQTRMGYIFGYQSHSRWCLCFLWKGRIKRRKWYKTISILMSGQ